MSRTESAIRSMLASACALLALLAAASCESTTQVGSDCRDGVCPRADLISARPCVISSTVAELGVTRFDNDADDEPVGRSICMPRPLPTDARGRVDCQVVWLLDEVDGAPEIAAPSPEQCSDLPFLTPAGPGYPSNACIARQLTADEVAAGEAEGWYFDNEGDDELCADGAAAARFRPAIWSRVVVQIECSGVQAVGTDGELVEVDPGECGALPDASADDVGEACLPTASPAGGFDDREAYLETRSDECDTGACLVYRLRGSADPECNESTDAGVICAGAQAVEDHAYCSCRCDAPADDPGPRCECADGFTCVPIFEDGPDGTRGSYCVKDGTFNSEGL